MVAAASNPLAPTTVDQLDLNSFVGTWYQMASDWIVLNTFEKDAFCATAKYTPAAGKIEVHNYARLYNTTGEVYTIDGVADVPDEDEALALAQAWVSAKRRSPAETLTVAASVRWPQTSAAAARNARRAFLGTSE